MSAKPVKYNPTKQKYVNADVAFKMDLKEFWPKVVAVELHDFAKDMAKYALKRVIELTPVETGETLSLWFVSLNKRKERHLKLLSRKNRPSGSAALRRVEASTYARGEAVINSSKPGDIIIIHNDSVVAQIIEFGLFEPPDPGPSKQKGFEGLIRVKGGYSTQAPQGVVYVVQAEINQIFE